jgi:Family of unknown function (DUF5995)
MYHDGACPLVMKPNCDGRLRGRRKEFHRMTTAISGWPTTMNGVADRVRVLDRGLRVATVADRLLGVEAELNGIRTRTGFKARLGRHPDGVACFNFLYLTVTEQVGAAIGRFESPEFVERLAVVFAEFYFSAYEAAKSGAWVSNAWQPLFERRRARGIEPMQFALAGMNAHINNDLPWALMQTWDEFELEPRKDSPEFRDYKLVDTILASVQGEVRWTLQSWLLRWLDRLLGRLDDLFATFNVAKARAEAWERGARWKRRFDEEASAAHERTVGYASHLLLAL